MKNLNVISENDFGASFDWNYFENELSRVFRLTDDERKILHKSTAARLIATIPFAANCDDPFRTAILHLCAYMAELKGFEKYCSHLPSDDSDIMSRLDCISHFKGGDKKIIEHGMTMLSLIMLEGYRASQKKDLENGIYNPLNSGTWNYENLKHFFEAKLKIVKNPSLDEIYCNPMDSNWH